MSLADSVTGTGLIPAINASDLGSANFIRDIPSFDTSGAAYGVSANPSSNVLGSGTNSIFGGFGALFNPSGTTVGGQPATASSNTASSSTLSDLFLRGVVIILGFIFVAAALSMFRK